MNQEQAERLIQKELTGTLTESEAPVLRQWREAAPEHEQCYAETKAVWDMTRDDENRDSFDTGRGWACLEAELGDELTGAAPVVPMRPRRRGFNPLIWATMAAALIAAFLLLQPPENVVVRAPAGQLANMVLPDGTKIVLNGGSRLTYQESFDSSLRLVALEGQGWFEVAHEERPFVVETAAARIRVLGTRFDVREGRNQTRVVVGEGKVRVSNEVGEVLLTADQTTAVAPGRKPAEAEAIDAARATGWLEGRLSFHQQPLREVLLDLERRFGEPVILQDPIVAAKTLSAEYTDEDLATILEEISLTLGLQMSRRDNRYLLESP